MRYLAQFVAAALLGGIGMGLAQDLPITRDEKGYWTRTASGTTEKPVQARLRVIARGQIVVHGGSPNQMTFSVKQRVRADSEAQARRLLGRMVMYAAPWGDWTTLNVTPESSSRVITELEVTIPRTMLETHLETQGGGRIEAYDLDGNVEALTRSGLIRLDRIKGNAVAQTGGGEIRLGKIGGWVHCGTGAGSVYVDSSGRETNCMTAGGDMVVGETGGFAVLSTEGGNIRVLRSGGSIEAHSAEGVIEIGEARGVVTADTRGGSIQIGSSRGVRAESGSGMVRVKSLAGPMNVAAAAGSILAELLSGGRIENSSLVAGSGDITLLIPSNLAVSVMALSDSASAPRVVSDFAELRGSQTLFRPSPILGSINGGGPMLRLNASAGTIYLKRIK